MAPRSYEQAPEKRQAQALFGRQVRTTHAHDMLQFDFNVLVCMHRRVECAHGNGEIVIRVVLHSRTIGQIMFCPEWVH